jgi:hypothetical protein
MLTIRLSRPQHKNGKDHQAGDHDIRRRPQEECLVNGEAGDLSSLDVGAEVGTVEAEQVDVGEASTPRVRRS